MDPGGKRRSKWNSLEEETAGLTESLGVGLWKWRVQDDAWDLDVSKWIDSHTILNSPASFASSPPAGASASQPLGFWIQGPFSPSVISSAHSLNSH